MTSKNEKVTKLYIGIDCLLDVRMGTLTMINPERAAEIIMDPNYYTREEDLFGTAKHGRLSKATFQAVHDKYKDSIIRNSLRTRMLEFVREIMKTLSVQTIGTPYHSSVEIDVNTYPYEFTQEEADALALVVSKTLGDAYTINIVHQSNEDLVLDYVRETYRAMIWYKYHDWFNVYNEQIQRKALREVGFYVPRLWFDRTLTDAEKQECERHGVEPFNFVQDVLSPLVLLQYLPVALYCADVPHNRVDIDI